MRSLTVFSGDVSVMRISPVGPSDASGVFELIPSAFLPTAVPPMLKRLYHNPLISRTLRT
jgi:hypothetical protein